MKDFYIVALIFEYKVYYMLWYTSDVDRFLLDETNHNIKIFTDEASVYEFASLNQYVIHDEINEIVCQKSELLKMDCDTILSFWNIMSDIANSLNIQFMGDSKSDEISHLYDKLFYGCNLPSIKGNRENFIPAWSLEEQKLIAQMIDNGLCILESSLS